jgi:uncharacterized protein (DUF4415 family)
MPKLKAGTYVPTAEEDAALTAAAMSDLDSRPFTDGEWAAAKPKARVGVRGLQRTPTKVLLSVRYSREVVDYFKATGDGWQARMDQVLREYIATHR